MNYFEQKWSESYNIYDYNIIKVFEPLLTVQDIYMVYSGSVSWQAICITKHFHLHHHATYSAQLQTNP